MSLARAQCLPGWLSDKESACQAGDVRKIPWRGKWQPTPVFLLGKSQTEEPGGLQSMGSQRVRDDLVTKPPPPKNWKQAGQNGTQGQG